MLVLSLLFKPILWNDAVIVFETILDTPFCVSGLGSLAQLTSAALKDKAYVQLGVLLLDCKMLAPVGCSEHTLRLNDDAVVQHEVGGVGAVRKVFPLNLDLLVVIRDFESVKVD